MIAFFKGKLQSKNGMLGFIYISVFMFFNLDAAPASAESIMDSVPMSNKGASTFYVPCNIEGYGKIEMMVDTGSSYMTINKQTLNVLKKKGLATYIKSLDASMADGSRRIVPVYRIASISLGDNCKLRNIETAILPGTIHLLGLSALSKAGPFIFSTNPPQLILNYCANPSKET